MARGATPSTKRSFCSSFPNSVWERHCGRISVSAVGRGAGVDARTDGAVPSRLDGDESGAVRTTRISPTMKVQSHHYETPDPRSSQGPTPISPGKMSLQCSLDFSPKEHGAFGLKSKLLSALTPAAASGSACRARRRGAGRGCPARVRWPRRRSSMRHRQSPRLCHRRR